MGIANSHGSLPEIRYSGFESRPEPFTDVANAKIWIWQVMVEVANETIYP